MNAVPEAKDAGVSNGTPIHELTRPSRPVKSLTEEMIARRAYEIWQRHGCPSGTSYHDWLAAEAELRCSRS